ncbi:MAG: gephyrin-like molybdotransferase Glp [Candidatus Poseidoniaceae archaeon]
MAKPYPYFVSLNEAISLCQETQIKLNSEIIPISESINRIVSTDIRAMVNDPGFDNSAMDGFAVIHSDTTSPPSKLSIIGSLMAGSSDNHKLSSGQAIRIMTGAPIPQGADSIIPIEACTVNGDEVILNQPSKPHFIRKLGENFAKGQIIFSPGEVMSPEKIALCAAAGVAKISVFKKLKIAVISTGDELKSLDQNLEHGQIYESNSYGLAALVSIYGHDATRFPNVVDDLDTLRNTLNKAAENHDCIITSGGVSMGDKDFVRILMEQEGEIKFWRVKMRPGSPPIFGSWNKVPIFGLPGNPVSSHVVFRAIVGKWLTSLTNSADINNRQINAILAEDIKTQEGFTTFRRVELFVEGDVTFARLKGHQGSGNIAGIAMSDGLTIIEPDEMGNKGDVCKIILL